MGRKEPQMSLAKPGEAAPRQGQDAPQAPLARSLLSLTFLFQILKEIRKALSLRWLTPGPSRERTDGGGQAGRAGRRDPRALRSQDPEARGSGRNCKHRALLRSHFWARASAHSSAFARCRLLGGNVPLSGPGSTRHPPSGFLTRWSRPGGARGAAKAELPPPAPEFNCNKKAQPALDHAAGPTARSGPGLIEPGSPGNRFKGIQAVNHLQALSQGGLANKEPPNHFKRARARRPDGAGPGSPVSPAEAGPRALFAVRLPGPAARGHPALGRPRRAPDRPPSTADSRGREGAPRLGPGTAA